MSSVLKSLQQYRGLDATAKTKQTLDTNYSKTGSVATQHVRTTMKGKEQATKTFAIFVALLGLLLLAFYSLDILQRGGTDSSKLIVGRDFVNMHFGGGLIAEGHMTTLTDQKAYLNALREWAGPEYSSHNWSYPPLLFLPAEGLSALPYSISLALWTGLGVIALVGAIRYAGLEFEWAAIICLSPAGVANLLAGQNGFFTAALMVVGLITTLHRQSLLAGTSWALLTIKPHLGILILPFLVCRRETRVTLAGALVFLGFLSITIIIYGVEPWIAFFARTLPQQREVAETWTGPIEFMMPTFFMQARSLGMGLTGAYLVHISAAALTVYLLFRSWPERGAAPREWLSWLICGTYLILPYSFIYDFVVFQILLALWHDAPEKMLRINRVILARSFWMILWLLPVFLTLMLVPILAMQLGPSMLYMMYIAPKVLPLVLLALLWRLGYPKLDCAL